MGTGLVLKRIEHVQLDAGRPKLKVGKYSKRSLEPWLVTAASEPCRKASLRDSYSHWNDVNLMATEHRKLYNMEPLAKQIILARDSARAFVYFDGLPR